MPTTTKADLVTARLNITRIKRRGLVTIEYVYAVHEYDSICEAAAASEVTVQRMLEIYYEQGIIARWTYELIINEIIPNDTPKE